MEIWTLPNLRKWIFEYSITYGTNSDSGCCRLLNDKAPYRWRSRIQAVNLTISLRNTTAYMTPRIIDPNTSNVTVYYTLMFFRALNPFGTRILLRFCILISVLAPKNRHNRNGRLPYTPRITKSFHFTKTLHTMTAAATPHSNDASGTITPITIRV